MRALSSILMYLIRVRPLLAVLLVVSGITSGMSTAVLLSMVGDSLRQGFEDITQLVILALVSTGGFAISQYASTYLGADTLFRLRLMISSRVLAMSHEELEQLGPARVQATLTEDVPRLANAISFAPDACTSLLIILCSMGYLAWLSPAAFAVFLILALAIAILLVPGFRIQIALSRVARKHVARLFELFDQMFDGHTELTLHLLRRRNFWQFGLQKTAKNARTATARMAGGVAYINSITRGAIFVLLLGILLSSKHMPSIDASVVMSFALIIMFLVGPLTLVISYLSQAEVGYVALQHLREFGPDLDLTASLDTPGVDASTPVPKTPSVLTDPISVWGLRYEYPEGEDERTFAIGPIDAVFKPGEITFIVGGNGSGKSTLVKTLVGLYPLDRGELQIGNTEVTEENMQWYREHFAVVLTDFALFDENWGGEHDRAFGDELLRQLRLQDKVSFREDGSFSSTRLSTGQRKRLALISALMADRAVYVFDEWAADQDPSFRHVFYRSILPALRDRGKIVIAVTHDDRYFDVADHRLKLDQGQVSTDETRQFMVRLHQNA